MSKLQEQNRSLQFVFGNTRGVFLLVKKLKNFYLTRYFYFFFFKRRGIAVLKQWRRDM